jgi:excisionase family DNA binding protein
MPNQLDGRQFGNSTSQGRVLAPYRAEDIMENTSNILTIREVADILRCSKAHVQNALRGKVPGVPKLTHLTMGRRKLVRRDWLDQWLEANKTL